MTATSFHHQVRQLLDGDADALPAVERFVRRCDRRLDDDGVAQVIVHVLELARGPGLPDPDPLLLYVRKASQRLGARQRRRREREVPHVTEPTVRACWPSAEALIEAAQDTRVWGMEAHWIELLRPLVEVVIATYRVDHRATARRTWALWWWQRQGDPSLDVAYRSMDEVVARDGNGLTRRRRPTQWRRHRDKLLRRRSRFRERLRRAIEAQARSGALAEDDARYLLDRVLPWLSDHSTEDDA